MQTTTTLSPGQQNIFNAVQGGETVAAQRMQGLLGTGVDTSGLGRWGTMPGSNYGGGITNTTGGTPGYSIQGSIPGAGEGIRSDYESMGNQDYAAQRQQVEDAIMSRVQPQYDRDRASMDARLAAQGFNIGSQGYQNAAGEVDRSLTDARMQAVLAGGQEQTRMAALDAQRVKSYNDMLAGMNTAQQQGFTQRQQAGEFGNAAQQQAYNQALSEAGFRNTAQQQGYNEALQQAQGLNTTRGQQLAETLQLRSQPINEVASLFGLGNQIAVPQAPQFQGAAIAAPNYADMVQKNYQTQAANATSTNNAVAGTVGTAIMAGAIAY